LALLDESELLEDPHRRVIFGQHPGLDPMEAQDGESVPDNGPGGLRREPPAPQRARDLVAELRPAMLEIEPVQSRRADHLAGLDQLYRPADRIPGCVALLEPIEDGVRLGQCRERRHAVVPGDLWVSKDG
jgi:hypothetical protein